MGAWGIGHWIVVLLIVLVIFGTKKLRNIGSDLGGAVKGFKDGVKSGGVADAAGDATAQVTNRIGDADTVDVEVKAKTDKA